MCVSSTGKGHKLASFASLLNLLCQPLNLAGETREMSRNLVKMCVKFGGWHRAEAEHDGREVGMVRTKGGPLVSPIPSTPVPGPFVPAAHGHLGAIPTTSHAEHASLVFLSFNQHRDPS